VSTCIVCGQDREERKATLGVKEDAAEEPLNYSGLDRSFDDWAGMGRS
jgi:hypothetical protein